MERALDEANISQDLYIPNETSIGSVPAQSSAASSPPPPRPTSSPSTLLPATPLQPYDSLSYVQQHLQSIPSIGSVQRIPTPTPSNEPISSSLEGSAMTQLLESVRGHEGLTEQLSEDMNLNEESVAAEPKLDEPVEIPKDPVDELSEQSPGLLELGDPSPPVVTSSVSTAPVPGVLESVTSNNVDMLSTRAEESTEVLPLPKVKPAVRVVLKRKLPFSALEMKNYADTLQPVDCVILMERCAPFSGGTRYMDFFKSEYLSKLLCDLNGGPPVDTEFGRDAYTSLYSLHTFDWHKPEPSTAQINDTAIIKSLYTKIDELRPQPVPPVAVGPDEGIPVIPLLRAALAVFGHLDTLRRYALGKCQRRRHLILLMVSPCVSLDQLEAEAVVLSGDVIAENTSAPIKEEVEKSNGITKTTDNESDSLPQKGVLARLRELLVAVSIFSPIEDKNYRKLSMLCNMLKPDIRRDSGWPTVIFSREILQISLAQRHITPPTAVRRTVPPPSSPQQKRFQQAGFPGQPSGAVLGMGSKEPSPRQSSQQQQSQQIMFMAQQQVPTMMHHMAGSFEGSVPSPHQTRMPVPYGPGSNSMITGVSQPHTAYSGPSSIEPAMGHQHMQQQQPGLQRPLGGGSTHSATGPNSVPDAFGNAYQASPIPPSTQSYGLAPPMSVENQGVRPMLTQQQQQYYSPMPPTPYEADGALSGPSPDQYLRVSYPPNPSPVCSNPSISVSSSAGDSHASASVLQNPSPSQQQQQQQQQGKQQTPQQQLAASPYGGVPGTPHSGEQGSVHYHMRQHASPYQTSQPSPMATGGQMPVSTAIGPQQYHTPSAQAYAMSEMNRYANTSGGSPMNTPMRTPAGGQTAPTVPSTQQSSGGRVSGGPGKLTTAGEEHSVIWEGQLSLGVSMAVYVKITADPSAPRIIFPWQNNPRLMMQLEHFDRESHWGQVLIHRAPSFLLPTQLSIGFKSPENQAALQSRFQSPSSASFAVAIIPPLSSFGQIPSGSIAFICLVCVGDSHIIGLIPRNADTFRDDIIRRQMHRRQQQQQQQSHQQYDGSLLEMQSQLLQQQQPSPAYSVNTPSMPNTPNKVVRPSTATPSPVISRAGNTAGMPPQRVSAGAMIEESEQQQQFMAPLYQQMVPQQQQQQQQQAQQLARQPSWQEQQQRQAGMTSEMIQQQQQQQQRAYQSYQQQQQQQMIASSVPGGQQAQQQHLYHQGQGMPMNQSSAYIQQKIPAAMPQGQPRPQTYPGSMPPRQQLRDASGRFQSTSNAAAVSANPEYHTTPLPPAYTSTSMYEMPPQQQYGGMSQQRMTSTGYARNPQPSAMAMRSGAGFGGGPRMAGYPAGRGSPLVGRGSGMHRGGGMMRGPPPHLMMTNPGEPQGLMYESGGGGGMMDTQQGQLQPQQQQGVFDGNMPQNPSNMFE